MACYTFCCFPTVYSFIFSTNHNSILVFTIFHQNKFTMVVFCAVSGIIIVTNFKKLFENVKKIMYNYASTSKLWDIKFDICCFMQERLCHIFGNAFAQNIYCIYVIYRCEVRTEKNIFPRSQKPAEGKYLWVRELG